MGIDTEALESQSAASRPLRVGLIAPPWLPVPPVGYGGIETIVDVLARGLADHGHEVVLFASSDSTCPVELRAAMGPAPGVDVGGSAVEIHHAVSAYESLSDVDVIHDHTAVGPLVALARATRQRRHDQSQSLLPSLWHRISRGQRNASPSWRSRIIRPRRRVAFPSPR